MADLDTLTKKRQIAKRNITRIKNIVSENMSVAELECRFGLLEAYFKQILSIQTSIEELNPKDAGRAELEEHCIQTKANIIQLLGDNYKRSNLETSMTFPISSASKLPSLQLPRFNGTYSNYRNFITSFKQLVDKDSSLSSIEKFNHLLHCLSGQALDTVRSFQITGDNYTKALKRLEERYDNTTLIFLEHIANLYNLPDICKPSSIQLRSLVDSASAIFSSLKSLGSTEDICNSMLIHLISQKVDPDTRLKWKENLDFGSLPSWDTFSKQLERRCQFLESTETRSAQIDSPPTKSHRRSISRQQSNRCSFYTQHNSCTLCKRTDHWIIECTKFKSMEAPARFDTVKKLGLCLNCLSDSHGIKKCTSKNKCKICHKSHHTLLHRSSAGPDHQEDVASTSNAASASVNTNIESVSNRVILATAVVLVRDASGEYKLGRALLDSCSQVNLITESFAKILDLPKKKTHVNILGVEGSSSKIKYETQTQIRSRYNEMEFDTELLISARLSGYQPESELDISSWKLPAKLNLADEHFYQSQPIDLLLGAESFFNILRTGQLKLGTYLPILQETSFGWVVSGR